MEAGHDHVERGVGGKSPIGAERREVRVPRGKSDEREEGQTAPFIVGQVYGAGHTWLLPGKCGWSLDRILTHGTVYHSPAQGTLQRGCVGRL